MKVFTSEGVVSLREIKYRCNSFRIMFFFSLPLILALSISVGESICEIEFLKSLETNRAIFVNASGFCVECAKHTNLIEHQFLQLN